MNPNGQIISLGAAAVLTNRFRGLNPAPDTVIAELFDADLVRQIIDQPECTGLRIYHGLDNDLSRCLILVGCDQTGNDLVNGIIVEMGSRCPIKCASANPLNS